MHLLCTDGLCAPSCRPFFLSESLSQAKRPQHPGGKGCGLPSHVEMYRLRCAEAGEMHSMTRDFPPQACGDPEIWHPRSNLNQRGETHARELPETKGDLWRRGSLPHQGYITRPSAQGHASRCHCLQATSLPRNAAAVGAGRPAEGGKCFLHTRARSSAHPNKATRDLATHGGNASHPWSLGLRDKSGSRTPGSEHQVTHSVHRCRSHTCTHPGPEASHT